MTDQALFEKYDSYNKDTKIYETINEWDTCSPNVLANKIKKVSSYLENFKNDIQAIDKLFPDEEYNIGIDKTEFLYKTMLRHHFKNIEDFYVKDKTKMVLPTTWSVNVGKDYDYESDNPYYIKNKYYALVNTTWLDYYPRWIETYLELMRNRLEESKQKTAKKEQTEITCECGGKYKPTNKSHHFKSAKHLKFIGDL